MPKPEFSEKLKNETPDPKAFRRFEQFTKKILKVSKQDTEEINKADSRSTSTN